MSTINEAKDAIIAEAFEKWRTEAEALNEKSLRDGVQIGIRVALTACTTLASKYIEAGKKDHEALAKHSADVCLQVMRQIEITAKEFFANTSQQS